MELKEIGLLDTLANVSDAVAIFECKAARKAVYVNPAFTKQTGLSLKQLEKINWLDMFSDEQQANNVSQITNTEQAKPQMTTQKQLLQAFVDGRDNGVTITRLNKKSAYTDSLTSVSVAVSYLKNQHGRAIYFMVTMRDVTLQQNSIKQLNEQISEQQEKLVALKTENKYDHETGLLNISALDGEVSGLFASSSRVRDTFSLGMMGIKNYDELKELSEFDRVQVLNRFADYVKSHFRRVSDLVMRYTESDFIFCFTGQTPQAAASFIERLNGDINDKVFGDIEQKVIVSSGVHTGLTEGWTVNEFILKADVQMLNGHEEKDAQENQE